MKLFLILVTGGLLASCGGGSSDQSAACLEAMDVAKTKADECGAEADSLAIDAVNCDSFKDMPCQLEDWIAYWGYWNGATCESDVFTYGGNRPPNRPSC